MELTPGTDGFHSGLSAQARAGVTYFYVLDDGPRLPDPYSRFQPEGPTGPSMVVDPSSFAWSDTHWPGVDCERSVVYELHIGTFTAEGTFRAAVAQLPRLVELGMTCIELMPVGEFAGRWGWGYDGTHWFAPFHHYGTPDDLRFLVDSAHACGLGVILDVVYNHVGAQGNSLPSFSDQYFTQDHSTDWGEAFNYAHPVVRRLALDNVGYWIREFHTDGFRLDAIQGIHDPEHPRLFSEMADEAREAAGARSLLLTAEDYRQRSHLLGGSGFTQIWNDDYHHSLRVALTGSRDGYYEGYEGSAGEMLAAIQYGFLFQGQYDGHFEAPRGESSLEVPPSSLIAFTQNHDQVANTLGGIRIHQAVSPAKKRVMTALLLLGPNTPLIFMGQEFDSDTPFYYFADYPGHIAQALAKGRREEGSIFSQSRDPELHRCVPEPCDPSAFECSKLSWSDMPSQRCTRLLYRDLLALRRLDPVLSARPLARLAGAVLTENAFVLRWLDPAGADRLLVVNLGAQIGPRPIAQPLLAPPRARIWRTVASTDAPRYGGAGQVAVCSPAGWHIMPESAHFLIAESAG